MESALHVKDRDIVVPGMVLAQGMDYLPSKGTYRKDDKILAKRLGLVQMDGKVIKTVPLAGKYLPKKDDIVIGKVIDVLLQGWRVEMNAPYESVLTLKEASGEFIQRGADLTQFFALNDWVVTQVVQVTSQNLIDISMRGPGLRKLVGGTIIEVNAQKVPRIVGKRGSMVEMVKRATDCNIIVGQNGRIWLNGTPQMEKIAIEAINLIEKNTHTSGLTERVKQFLFQATGREVTATEGSGSGYGDAGGSEGGHAQSTRREYHAPQGGDRQRSPVDRGAFRRLGFRNTNGQEGGAPAHHSNGPAHQGPSDNTDSNGGNDNE